MANPPWFKVLGGLGGLDCSSDIPGSSPARAILEFFSLNIEETYTFMNIIKQKLRETEIHAGKVK